MRTKRLCILLAVTVLLIFSSCDPVDHFEEEKETIYSVLKEHYVGFTEMENRGFTKEAWDNVANYAEVKELFDKCINDTHLYISNNKGFTYRQNQVFDSDSIKSNDPDRTFIQKTTSNTYYIRYNSCDITWQDYSNFPSLADEAYKYDYIVLDFRSNNGGGNQQQFDFFYNLYQKSYSGTIYVTQDNWSYSSGEVWIMANRFIPWLNIKLIGTHSGGMQIYGNCENFQINGMYFYLPQTSFATQLPANYLGEGKGYEPDIWANKNNMKSKLEQEGLDLKGITFN